MNKMRFVFLGLFVISMLSGCQWNKQSKQAGLDEAEFGSWDHPEMREEKKESKRPSLLKPSTWFSADTQPTGLSAQSRDIERRLNVGRED